MRWIVLMVFVCPVGTNAADWPTFLQNNQRNGKSPEKLSPKRLTESWKWISPTSPTPAWSGPAKWDAYAEIRNLKSMRNYDPVFHVVSSNGKVWFGSSSDHHVYCLNADTGDAIWTFATDGAVRIAPTFENGQLYFGSDDGHAYCVHATKGWEKWKVTPRRSVRHIVNNGNLISQWPIRSGVAVEAGICYFAASLLPWQESYLCAVDAKTGKHGKPGTYIRSIDDATLEGPLAISPGRLLVAPQGRVAPQLFSLRTGKKLGDLTGGGGSFVVLTPESIVHGPGNKTGWLTNTSLKSKEKIASLRNSNAIVVAGGISFVLGDQELTATDLQKKETLWTTDTQCNLAMILADDTLFAGGTDEFAAYDSQTGTQTGHWEVDGRVFGLAVANEKLFVSTDRGIIYGYSESDATIPPPHLTQTKSANVEPSSEDFNELRHIKPFNLSSTIGHWAFQKPHVSTTQVKDLSFAEQHASIDGQVVLQRVGNLQAIKLDGRTSGIQISRDITAAKLPKGKFTAEAWVRVDKPANWGAFVGCIQDNGDYERGWLLGYTGQKLCFAVSSKSGSGRLTYLTDKNDYKLRGWHYVVGTYDGTSMNLFLDGKLANTSTAEKGEINYPPKATYELAAYRDDNEHYVMQGMLHEVAVHETVFSPDAIAEKYADKAAEFPLPESAPGTPTYHQLAVGPWLEFTSPQTATVKWRTSDPTTATLKLYLARKLVRRYESSIASMTHGIKLENLKHKRRYHYQIELPDSRKTKMFECDTLFNYRRTEPAKIAATRLGNMAAIERFVEDLTNESFAKNGICVVLGCGNGELLYELARQTNFKIIAFDQDIDRVERVRHELLQAGLAGRANVHIVDSLETLPITGRFANLVVSGALLTGDETSFSFDEAKRILAPDGVAVFTQNSVSKDWIPIETDGYEIINRRGHFWAIHRSEKIEGSGEWSHIYGSANNTHYGGEALARVAKAEDLIVQWVGLPGARYQADRNGRKTPPLSTSGRIFLQGLDRLIALDQYNGAILWSLEIPFFRRFNIPRDCSNWCADSEFVFAAIRDKCWRIDANTGEILTMLDLPNSSQMEDWGYIARTKNLLIGSAVRSGNIWTEFWGKEAWYDGTEGEVAAKVCSDRIFAIERESDRLVWEYQKGVIINASISIENQAIVFVESRNRNAIRRPTRRQDGKEFWSDLFLVSIDSKSGQRNWEKELNIQSGDVAFYAAAKDDHIVLVSSKDKQYYVYNFGAADGNQKWMQSTGWGKGKADHGSHLSRPAITGNQLFVRPAVFDLQSGDISKLRIPVGGCGTYAATDTALFFRGGSGNNSAIWNNERGDYTMWNRLRPDCWLSTIPAGGMLLSPEGGGGCSCGKWMETSLGFIPKKTLDSWNSD